MSEALFKLLFVQLIEHNLALSVPEGDKDAEPDNELAFYRIERIGFQLDVFKYLCKDYWSALFHKQIDNLKTNHRGVYVLHDSNFSWIAPFASDIALPDTARMAVLYLAFPCGLLRGALAGLGIQANVTAEIPAFNQCSFQVRINGSVLP